MGQTVTSEADNMDAAKAEVAALYSLVAPTYGTIGPRLERGYSTLQPGEAPSCFRQRKRPALLDT